MAQQAAQDPRSALAGSLEHERLPSLEVRCLSARQGHCQTTHLGALLQFHREFFFAPPQPPPDLRVARPLAPADRRRFQTGAWLEFVGDTRGPGPDPGCAAKQSLWAPLESPTDRG